MPKRTPGRPPLDPHDPSVAVHLKVTGTMFDDLCTEARRYDVSLGAVVRRRLRLVEMADARGVTARRRR